MPPNEEVDIAVLKNDMKHLKDAVEELTSNVLRLTEAVNNVRLSQAKLATIITFVGTAGGGAGAVLSKMFF